MSKLIDRDALIKMYCEDCDNRHLCKNAPECMEVQQILSLPFIEKDERPTYKSRLHSVEKRLADLSRRVQVLESLSVIPLSVPMVEIDALKAHIKREEIE